MNFLDLTDSQLAAITAATECWVEGFPEAVDDVINDTWENPEQLLEAVDSINHDYANSVAALRILHLAGVNNGHRSHSSAV